MMTRTTFLLLSLVPFAFADSKSDPINHNKAGIAIQGYDPVAYFTDSKPLKGDARFSYSWRGATWEFANAEHRELFAKDPEHFAPQYGGYCAYGVSENHAVNIDPEAWKIIEGKLYLNYSQRIKVDFLKDPAARIQRADRNWPNLHN